jgi:bifunctional non-homologous end joining protein LigD
MAKSKPTAEVTFTHLDKVFFPRGKFTKGDLVRYYVGVSEFMLPHLKNRPVTLIRYPDGVTGIKFYEKNAPKFTPDWVRTFLVPRRHENGGINYILINDARTLAWCANIAAIEIHPFLHRAPALDRPTHLAFDLDPGEGADLVDCSKVAFLIRKILDQLGLKAFPKVTGSKGLQLFVPLNSRTTYESTGTFAKAVAEFLERQNPEQVVSRMTKIRRKGRVLIDWSQNSPSKTTVSVYSVRGKHDEPFVSMPVRWDELEELLKTKRPRSLFFDPDQALQRLAKIGDIFSPVLSLRQTLPRAFAPRIDPGDSALKSYAAKRDFTKTREPSPSKPTHRGKSSGGRFVVQKHAASHLHYDFRLEMNGTLKSWAVPKGLPFDLGVKRAAFAVEDHPLAYINFEGTIPKGEYGGGTVMVWDTGKYDLLGGDYADGDLKLMLRGKKLVGEWHMFKIRSEGGKDVWLITKSGRPAKSLSARQEDSSVLTRRSMARIARDDDAHWSGDAQQRAATPRNRAR